MKAFITINPVFYNQLEENIRDFLEKITPSENNIFTYFKKDKKEIKYFLKKFSPQGKVEGELNIMLDEIVENNEMQKDHAELLKKYYGIDKYVNYSNFKNYKSMSGKVFMNEKKLKEEIKYAIKDVKKYLKNNYQEYLDEKYNIERLKELKKEEPNIVIPDKTFSDIVYYS